MQFNIHMAPSTILDLKKPVLNFPSILSNEYNFQITKFSIQESCISCFAYNFCKFLYINH